MHVNCFFYQFAVGFVNRVALYDLECDVSPLPEFCKERGIRWDAPISGFCPRRFDEVRSLARYLVFDFHDAIQKLPGSTELQKNVVEQSLGYLDRLAREAGNDTELRLEVAEGYLRLGDVLGNPFMPNLGNAAKAVESYDKGLALAEPVWRDDPSHVRAKRAVADLKQQRGSSSGFHGTKEAGVQELKEALDLRRGGAPPGPQDNTPDQKK